MTSAAPAAPALDVVHDAARGCFEAVVEGLRCECVYRRLPAEDGAPMGVVAFTHTEVPARLEGRGIAAALVRNALDWARAEGLRVRPLCSYVALYMRRHPETADLLAPR